MMDTLASLAPAPGLTANVCAALNLSRGQHLPSTRRSGPAADRAPAQAEPATHARCGGAPNRADLLRAPRFADQAPGEVYASLLDEGVYHCLIRTMYRILTRQSAKTG
jgi:putative transposase